MLSFHPFVAAFVVVAFSVGDAGAQEPVQVPNPKPVPSAPSNDKPKSNGINCTHGIACPIISVPVPDVPLDTPKSLPSRP
jgi:hypothetical protein